MATAIKAAPASAKRGVTAESFGTSREAPRVCNAPEPGAPLEGAPATPDACVVAPGTVAGEPLSSGRLAEGAFVAGSFVPASVGGALLAEETGVAAGAEDAGGTG